VSKCSQNFWRYNELTGTTNEISFNQFSKPLKNIFGQLAVAPQTSLNEQLLDVI